MRKLEVIVEVAAGRRGRLRPPGDLEAGNPGIGDRQERPLNVSRQLQIVIETLLLAILIEENLPLQRDPGQRAKRERQLSSVA